MMAQTVKNLLRDEDQSRKTEAEPASQASSSGDTSLKGTFVSVMLLGAFLLATWVTVFVLYVHRK